MSPTLFNIVADMLGVIIKTAKDDGQIMGIIPHLVDDGLSILQYADDTIIFMDHDIERAKNLKSVRTTFEQMSGLKINFHKNELFCYDQVAEFKDQYMELSSGIQRPIHRALNSHSDTWVYRCTTKDSIIAIGISLMRDLIGS